MECVEEVVDARNGMRVFHGRHVELPEVHTELQAAVLFLHQDDRRGPGAVGGMDDAAGQHLLDLGHLFSMNSRDFGGDTAGGVEVLWSLWCAAGAACSPDHPLLGSQCR